jgi:hypothetical protein
MMKELRIIVIVSFFALLTVNFAYAVRPLYTEDSNITPAGKVILESGILLLSNRDNTGVKELTNTIRYGLGNNMELSMDLPYLSRGSYSVNYDGLSNGTFQIKYNFYSGDAEKACFLLGYLVDTEDPNQPNQNLDQHDITTMFIYSKFMGGVLIDINMAYTFDDEPSRSAPEDFIIYNIALSRQLNDSMVLMAETQYSKNTLTGNIIHEIAVGGNYLFNEHLILDCSIGCGLTESSSSSNVAFGATYLF